ncbi:rhomboid family intramembrane serine protease [Staphylococcus massiliensis]|uniref:rhomboid family protein n=1 Tax=Staphylococcus massiliensis TaxID=555791 RepID=UPI001EDD7952|nr:rhomboid family intramembrane serine protease [Staphylococcus massiliensis]MCG3413033.1 rhomboid family intramembrane serine protease [Staphylococcus massiliensis]
MISEKYYWQTIHRWMKYSNYEIAFKSKDLNEIWLKHTKRHEIAIFKYGSSTSQEIRFDKSRILEHPDNINRFLGFRPEAYKFYYFTDRTYDTHDFNEYDRTKMTYHFIESQSDLASIMSHPIAKRMANRKDSKSASYYKKRVLNENPIERHMNKFSPITYGLILLNVIIWALINILHHNEFTDLKLIDLGALAHFNVVHGEWHRLITSMFLHLNFEHILFNMLSLFIFGKLLESILGSWRMFGVYMLSGIIGNLVTLAFSPDTFSLGASGAIFGLIGSLIACMIISQKFDQRTIGQLLLALLIMVVISLFISNINVLAHIGGLLGGVLVTFLGYYFLKDRKLFCIIIACTAFVALLLLIKIFVTQTDNIYNRIIREQMYENHYDEAEHMINQTKKKDYADDYTYYLSGLINATKNSKAEAMADWERGLKIFPKSSLLHFEMAIANRSLGDLDTAKEHINKAVKYAPNVKKYKDLKHELEDDDEE